MSCCHVLAVLLRVAFALLGAPIAHALRQAHKHDRLDDAVHIDLTRPARYGGADGLVVHLEGFPASGRSHSRKRGSWARYVEPTLAAVPTRRYAMLRNALRRSFRLYQAVTDPVGHARSLGVQVGEGCRFLGSRDSTWGSEPYLIRIGNHVTITMGVKLVTHDGGVWVFRDRYPDVDVFGPITIGNNVFVGFDTIIMPGVTIGDNCVIGAGAVVTRDIPSGSVAAGVPARVVRTVDEYWERVKGRVTHIRSQSAAQKRATLQELFRERLLAGAAKPSDGRGGVP